MQAATPASGATPPSPRRRGPRPRHSREDVVRAAVAIADSDGLDAVTFRAVAARLGTGVMSLYNYVPDKQALVYEMVELVSAELDLPVINMSFGAGWTAANNWEGDYGTVGDLSGYANYSNAHTYPNVGQLPDAEIQDVNGLAKMAASTRPVTSRKPSRTP